MHVHFRVHGAGKKNLHGDGIALWYTRDRLVSGRAALELVGACVAKNLPLCTLLSGCSSSSSRNPEPLESGRPFGKRRSWILQLNSVPHGGLALYTS